METTKMLTMKPYTVPTKQGDESETRPMANIVEEPQQQHDDAFSRYSNDLLRMKALLLLSEDEDLQDDDDDDLEALAAINRVLSSVGTKNLQNKNKRRRGNNSRRIQEQQGNVRKTRISWELHPDLHLHDLMLELDAIELDGPQRISDDEGDDDSTKKQTLSQEKE